MSTKRNTPATERKKDVLVFKEGNTVGEVEFRVYERPEQYLKPQELAELRRMHARLHVGPGNKSGPIKHYPFYVPYKGKTFRANTGRDGFHCKFS